MKKFIFLFLLYFFVCNWYMCFGAAPIPEPEFSVEVPKTVYNVANSRTSCAFNAPLQCLRYIPLFRKILAFDDGVS
jgi:hypothetical protein